MMPQVTQCCQEKQQIRSSRTVTGVKNYKVENIFKKIKKHNNNNKVKENHIRREIASKGSGGWGVGFRLRTCAAMGDPEG